MAAGRHQLPFVTMAAINGGNVRVGLEDSLYAGKGKLARSNAEQVGIIRSVLDALSLDVATPQEARQILDLTGAARVGRSEERRGGEECGRTCRSRWSPDH